MAFVMFAANERQVMMGWSSHLSYRLMAMIRGQLTVMVYTKMLTLPTTNADESSAMSLVGTDVQRIAETFWQLLIEILPSILQLGIAVYLLYDQLGAVCVAPVLITVICTGLSVLAAKAITSRQRAWLEAVQKRINYTSEILGSMKSVKILGLIGQQTANIQKLRNTEITTSKKYRKVQSLNISLGAYPQTIMLNPFASLLHRQLTTKQSTSLRYSTRSSFSQLMQS